MANMQKYKTPMPEVAPEVRNKSWHEVACGYSEAIADAQASLLEAADVLEEYQDLESLIKQTIITINQITEKLNDKNEAFDGVFNEYTAKEAIINMCGDIAEKRTRDLYLLRFGGNK